MIDSQQNQHLFNGNSGAQRQRFDPSVIGESDGVPNERTAENDERAVRNTGTFVDDTSALGTHELLSQVSDEGNDEEYDDLNPSDNEDDDEGLEPMILLENIVYPGEIPSAARIGELFDMLPAFDENVFTFFTEHK